MELLNESIDRGAILSGQSSDEDDELASAMVGIRHVAESI